MESTKGQLNSNAQTLGGREAHAHIPILPKWTLFLRIFQILMAIIILALSAYSLSVFPDTNAYGFGIFTSIYTFIFLGYILATTYSQPAFYNAWAHLALEILAVIFWLTAWALQANIAAILSWYYSGYRLSGSLSAVKGCTQGAAALGAFTWVTFIVTLAMTVLGIHRMRKGAASTTPAVVEQGHNMQPMTGAPAPQQYNGTPYGAPQQEAYAPQQPYGAPAPQGYAPEQNSFQPQQQYAQNSQVAHQPPQGQVNGQQAPHA